MMPLSFLSLPKKAEAQSVASIAGYTSGLAAQIYLLPQCKSIRGGINDLFNSGLDAVGNLFKSSAERSGDAAMKRAEERRAVGAAAAKKLADKARNAAKAVDSLNVNISDTAEGKAILDTYNNTEEIKTSNDNINRNSTCIQSIGRLIAKMLLQKLTVSTVTWINSGFDGNPSFIQDPGKFFNDIAKKEILQFDIEINGISPFSKDWLKNNALAVKNKFADNARYSLNKMIASTTPNCGIDKKGTPISCDVAFSQDFSVGGWDAWTAMTQVPANNPLGFKLMADNEIQKRLDGVSQSVAKNTRDALQAANGFLGDQRCVDPKGVTKQEDAAGLVERSTHPPVISTSTYPFFAPSSYVYKNRICNQWEYVTPGKMIADKATEVMGYQNNSLLNVQDLNDAVAAVLDALLNQFSTSIYEKGFSNIGDQGSDGRLVFDTSGSGEPYRTQTEKDYIPSQLSSSWLQANPEFNIRTDLTQALIDEQRTYSDKLVSQNKELLSTTDGKEYKLDYDPVKKISNAYGLIPVIYQLDYCIPGPHPGWEEDSQRTLNAVTNLIISETEQSLTGRSGDAIKGVSSTISTLAGITVATSIATSGAILGASLGSFAPVVGTVIGAVVGAIVGWIAGLFGSDDAKNLRLYYSSYVSSLTGMMPDYENDHDTTTGNISSKQGVVQGFNVLLSRYIEIMNKTYFSSKNILPTVAKEAATSFNQLTGYGQIVKDNEDKVSLLKTTVNLLGDIKDEVNRLNTDYKDINGQFKADLYPNDPDYATFTEANYEEALKAQINAFGRLSASMVNGDDIAKADNLSKQIIEKKDYIYKNLLKGPYGCETFLADPNNIINFPSAGAGLGSYAGSNWSEFNVNTVKRMTYPFPILYDYNVFAKGSNLPDPWTKCDVSTPPASCNNKMPDADVGLASGTYYQNGTNVYGPGFLSFVFFSADPARRGSQRLEFAEDVFGVSDTPQSNKYTAVGLRQLAPNATPDNDGARGGPFESIIGIY
ncbi:MAG: hypothetical protein NT161_00575 [Candidatus Nomurabacteria bacterium]|nr:hypothetical protein [Candidatus Nomurabacteria bacterium]